MGKKQGGRSSAKRRRTDGAGAADGVPISTSASPAAVPGSVAAAQAAIVAAGPEKGGKKNENCRCGKSLKSKYLGGKGRTSKCVCKKGNRS